MTLAELDQRAVEVLGLTLNRGELIEMLESARRHKLVAPLASAARPDGSHSQEAEWALTDAGRAELSSFIAWIGSRGASATKHIGVGVSILSAAGLLTALKDADIVIPFPIFAAALLVPAIVYLAIRVLYLKSRGASDPEIARRWRRYEQQCPDRFALIVARGEPAAEMLGFLLVIVGLLLSWLFWNFALTVAASVTLVGLTDILRRFWAVRKAKRRQQVGRAER